MPEASPMELPQRSSSAMRWLGLAVVTSARMPGAFCAARLPVASRAKTASVRGLKVKFFISAVILVLFSSWKKALWATGAALFCKISALCLQR